MVTQGEVKKKEQQALSAAALREFEQKIEQSRATLNQVRKGVPVFMPVFCSQQNLQLRAIPALTDAGRAHRAKRTRGQKRVKCAGRGSW